MQTPHIPAHPTLKQLQTYQDAACRYRGWDQSTDLETFLLFTEEVGELAKAIRNRLALYQEAGKKRDVDELEGEFADVLSYLMDLANRFEVDLTEAFAKKEAINAGRTWH